LQIQPNFACIVSKPLASMPQIDWHYGSHRSYQEFFVKKKIIASVPRASDQ